MCLFNLKGSGCFYNLENSHNRGNFKRKDGYGNTDLVCDNVQLWYLSASYNIQWHPTLFIRTRTCHNRDCTVRRKIRSLIKSCQICSCNFQWWVSWHYHKYVISLWNRLSVNMIKIRWNAVQSFTQFLDKTMSRNNLLTLVQNFFVMVMKKNIYCSLINCKIFNLF
uniref:Uncharacterized protein n=1 Tax=Onchocerca volvulus TaxID=6282 RepID=A0A8R1XQ39_ONCVO